MKRPSTNQEEDIVDYIYNIFVNNNPGIDDNTDKANKLYSDIEECVSEFMDNMVSMQ